MATATVPHLGDHHANLNARIKGSDRPSAVTALRLSGTPAAKRGGTVR